MDDVDIDALARHLGEDAAVDARTLAEIERALRDTGYLKRSSGRVIAPSSQAMRQLGRPSSKGRRRSDVGRQGSATCVRRRGRGAERTTRPWAFGDTESC